jgi:hypothetical protein
VTLDGDRLTVEKAGDDIDELHQASHSIGWRGTLAAGHLPLSERVTGAETEQHPSGSKDVECGSIRCRLKRVPDAGLEHIGTELQRRGYRGSRPERRPRRRAATRVISNE